MEKLNNKELLEAGAHFGHLKRKWNPKMQPYIFAEHKGIHLIDLNRTIENAEKAALALKQIAIRGGKIMFVATKKQARDIVKQAAMSIGMPFVTERWLGGMMTNFSTVKRSVKKMQNLDSLLNDETVTNITKKERMMMTRERDRIEKVLGGVANLTGRAAAVFIVDIGHEHIALKESKRLGIRTFGMVDTNCDPNSVDFAIPGNDDSSKSIALITQYVTAAIKEGLEEREKQKSAPAKEA